MDTIEGHLESPTVPAEVLEFLRSHETFYIIGHVEPDGDALASSLALASFLERELGKRARCFNVGPFDRREIAHLASSFAPRITLEQKRSDRDPAAIILDCSGPDRVGELRDDLDELPLLVIDHHATSAPYGDARFVVTTAAATAHLVQLVMEALEGTITQSEAELLLFAIATDTGYFRHVEADAADLFAAVSRLMAAGASPKKSHAQMFGGHSFASRQLLATLLLRAQPIGGGAGVITWETAEDSQAYGRAARDSDTLYQMLFSIDGVQTAGLVRQEAGDEVSGSLRSIDDIDVSTIARSFGGGGHKRAAGFTVRMPLQEAIARVRAELEAALNG